jgi:hypothetical protein
MVQRFPDQEASRSTCTTTPASKEEEHRGHFWPGLTNVRLRATITSASTVRVQMGQ